MLKVFQQLDKQREDPKHCDFTIKVGSEVILAHTNILSANSEYFEAMFAHETKEKLSGKVTIEEVDPLCVKKCVDYMYRYEISCSYEKFGELLHVATMIQLQEVCDGIIKFLEENLNPETFFITKKLSSIYNLVSLEERCDKFAQDNFGKISQLEDFGELDKNQVVKMIKSKKLKTPEENKLNAVLSWIKFNFDDRKKFANDLFSLVRLSRLSLGYRRHLIENEQVISDDKNLIARLSISVMDSFNIKSKNLAQATCNEAIVVFDDTSGYLQCFNPTDQTWTQMQEMNQEMKMEHFSAVTSDDFIYVLTHQKSVFRIEYADKDANWERMADMLEDHGSSPPAVVYKNFIYVIGGHKRYETAAVEKYDLATNMWTKCEDKPQATHSSEVISFQNQICSFGGKRLERYINAIELLNPETDEWKNEGHMAASKAYMSAVAVDEDIYILGGHINEHDHFSTVTKFNLSDCKLESKRSMLVRRSWFRTFAICDHIYAIGGYYSSPDSVERYDIAEDKWEMVEIPEHIGKLKILESVKINLNS